MQFCNEFPGSKYTLHLKVPKIAEFHALKLPIMEQKEAANSCTIFRKFKEHKNDPKILLRYDSSLWPALMVYLTVYFLCSAYQKRNILAIRFAPEYLQPHYGNGVFGNVYLLTLDNTKR